MEDLYKLILEMKRPRGAKHAIESLRLLCSALVLFYCDGMPGDGLDPSYLCRSNDEGLKSLMLFLFFL